MNTSQIKICVTLPSQIAYSETFLQAHVNRLAAAVNYLQDFPVDVAQAFPIQIGADGTERLKRQVRVCWHRYLLNPIKRNALRRFFKVNEINIVLAEYGLTGIGVVDLCQELKMPLAVHFHGYDAYLKELLERHGQAYRRMFEYAGAIIAVSKDMARQLVALGAPAAKVVYNPYGVEINRFTPASVHDAPPRVLAVGRFVEKKAPYLTILAFRKVLDRLPEAKLVMVGTGPLHDVCAKLIKALHMEHAVELKGVLGHAEVAELMRQSRVFVQHSLVPVSGDTEGTPLAVLEAGAAGLPVVSTKHAGISDVVIHGKTGFLVEEGDADGMAEHVSQVLTNAELGRELGKSARERISANFTMQTSIERLRNILERCAGESSTAAGKLIPKHGLIHGNASASY